MKINRITKNPYLLFSPFLFVLIAIALIFQTNGTFGDENRYLSLAENILHGFYSPPVSSIDFDLGNGPGYPLLLVPFKALSLPLVCITIMNAIFYYFSIILLYKVLQQIVTFKQTIIFTLFWACYINPYEYVPLIFSESLSVFLISLIVFNLVKAFNPDSLTGGRKYLLLSGFFIGYLALTKPIFGYVLLFMFVGSVLQWLINREAVNYKKGVIILSLALFTTAPYLIYTYSLTGRLFYWTSFGGDNLYWMSTPFKSEYGSWYSFNSFEIDSSSLQSHIPGARESIKANHIEVYKQISKFGPLEQDDALKRIAVNNIKSHPVKFMQNCISNVGRIVFNFPFTYKAEKPGTLLRLPFNGIIMVFICLCLLPTCLNWRKISYAIRFMLLFASLYFCGSILGSAETRMFTVIVPILLIWIAYVTQKTMSINMKFAE